MQSKLREILICAKTFLTIILKFDNMYHIYTFILMSRDTSSPTYHRAITYRGTNLRGDTLSQKYILHKFKL